MSTTFPPGSDENRQRLIESHLPLVRSVAKRYAGRGEHLEDLVQVGSIALIRASDRFDPERGTAFATFAAPAIEDEIRRHLGDRASAVRIPRELERIRSELQCCGAQLGSALGRAPTVAELATALDLDPTEVVRALDAERARQPGPSRPDEVVEGTAEPESLASTVDRLLVAGTHLLDERERRIVFLRFRADMTEQEIARDVGISQAHVSRSLSAALAKLLTKLSEEAGQPVGNADKPEPESLAPARGRGRKGRNGESHEADSAQPETESQIEQVATVSSAVSKKRGDPGSHHSIQLGSGGHSPARAWHPTPVEVAALYQEHPRRFQMLLAANIVVVVTAVVVASILLVLALERGI